jgi:hypothetical protein
MMTVREIEFACDGKRTLDFSKHPIETPELPLHRVFYPLGFPVEVRTNSAEILSLYAKIWDGFSKNFNTERIQVEVLVVESASTECPPAPTARMTLPIVVDVADADNYSIVDICRKRSRVTVSQAALRHKRYLRYHFLHSAGAIHIATRLTTPLHTGCVSLNKRGVLLCGDSGAGKSSLSYACGRAGWTYVTDDASFLLHGGGGRTVIGDSRRVRLRPSAAELFPEIEGLKMTPRAAGKPSIEMPTHTIPNFACARSAKVDFMVFLNRRTDGPPELVPYRKDVARAFMRQILYGSPEILSVQYEAIERLLEVDVLELRYTDMAWAIGRLRALVEEGR